MLALVADALVVLCLAAFVVSRTSATLREGGAQLRARVTPFALVAAWLVAALAMLGSLYLSEIAHLTPCRLCWYQRICMYPLVLLLGIAVFRSDVSTARRYLLPLAGVGALIAAYHYQLERFPHQPTLSCNLDAPCSLPVLDIWGFVSVPFMALAAFLLISTLLLLARDPADPGDASLGGD
ncbi:MAG TPA: disulfide oxidoreductase [Candidatus Limnocylindrales bacterium]|nr:disulfide oxidoreductase [Candidatus Limnocylindrales bacterium]